VHDASEVILCELETAPVVGRGVWRGGGFVGELVVECYGSRDEHKQTMREGASARQDPLPNCPQASGLQNVIPENTSILDHCSIHILHDTWML
jgi:hypothetical protein